MIELPVQAPPVRDFMVYLTRDCNLDCSYCFVKKRTDTMSAETAKHVVEFCFSRAVIGWEQSFHITFFGGEPFMAVDRLQEILDGCLAPRPNCYVRPTFSATTNGTYANPAVERVVRQGQLSLLVSLDGEENANLARPFVSGRPSYASVVRNLAKLREWARKISLRLTFHPANLNLVGNVERALELGADHVYLCPVEEAHWLSCADHLQEAYMELAQWFISQLRAGRNPPLEITWRYLSQFHRAQLGLAKCAERACEAGNSLLGILFDGRVVPCHRFLDTDDYAFGTVDSPNQLTGRQEFVDLRVQTCENCPTFLCGGGCRFVSLHAGTGLDGRHPNHCLLLKSHVQAVQHIYQTLRSEENPLFQNALRRIHAF